MSRGRGPTTIIGDALVGGAVAGVLSGIPSTVHAAASGGRVLEASEAAGSLVAFETEDPKELLKWAVPVHLALSFGWAAVLAASLPRRHTVAAGAVAGLVIAAVDLGVVGRRFERVRKLPLRPQLADHVAFGAITGAILARRRSARG